MSANAQWRDWAPYMAAALAFLILFWNPLTTMARDWLRDPDAGHGLLLAPLAFFLAWRRGRAPDAGAQPTAGLILLIGAILLRYGSGLAAELFTMRLSMFVAAAGLVVFFLGFRQLLHWWLPAALLVLSIPLPEVVIGTLALPLQLQASQLGAALLEWRDVPVILSGNVIRLPPDHRLFVTEACSGLRSLSALLSLGVLTGGIWLSHPLSRTFLVLLAIPVAMLLNGVRVFLTGFLFYFVDPSMADGFMHTTEGWIVFMIAFAILGAFAWGIGRVERLGLRRRRA